MRRGIVVNPHAHLPHLVKLARRTQAPGREPSCERIRSYIEQMGRSLVIVESPAKAKTINKYLGRDYTVKASLGHVLDLPKKTLGILLPGDQNGKKKKRKSRAKGKSGEKPDEKKAARPVVITDDNIFEPTLE